MQPPEAEISLSLKPMDQIMWRRCKPQNLSSKQTLPEPPHGPPSPLPMALPAPSPWPSRPSPSTSQPAPGAPGFFRGRLGRHSKTTLGNHELAYKNHCFELPREVPGGSPEGSRVLPGPFGDACEGAWETPGRQPGRFPGKACVWHGRVPRGGLRGGCGGL